MIKTTVKTFFILSIIMILNTGCTMKGNKYTANLDSVNSLQDKDLKQVAIRHNIGSSDIYEISLGRGTNVMVSPYTNFQEYLEKALKENLVLAGLLSNNSNIIIKATLKDSKLDTGLAKGSAYLSANFEVLVYGNEAYNKLLEVNHTWNSHFAAAIAIPKTIDNYVIAMQKLVDKFLFDQEVLEILKK